MTLEQETIRPQQENIPEVDAQTSTDLNKDHVFCFRALELIQLETTPIIDGSAPNIMKSRWFQQ